MRYEITIDTENGDENPDTPFTLNVYRDDADGIATMHAIGASGGALVGYDIPTMLRELADAWRDQAVIYEGDDGPAVRTGAEWLQQMRREGEG